MSISIAQVTFDSDNPRALADFWAAVLERKVDDYGNEFVATVGRVDDRGTGLMFIKVPEGRNGKNRIHLDLATADWAAEIDRLVGLGAKRLDEYDEYGTHWITFADPEGNLFDLAEIR
ncbi:putative enzyme related to lactoylglutathione lyase [Kribbella steppae]|uniref:Putative enzyme related to lactoylglutathione lyase n=1 Tax=Kribbella steppae TaxID=2512223 RepID=A0A4R2HVS4_9ACTN|nr:VOC family protein [Kribbella steppae]TCO34135.1 putative enzyme related to lactoylglutathione lyase [Kribbella steppae]